MHSRRLLIPTVAAAAVLLLSGCVDNTTGGDEPNTDSSAPTIAVDEAAAALLPAEIVDSGKLVVGTDAAYPPNEYKDDAGNPIGWDVDLVEALGAKLGLEVEYEIASFDKIIPSITGGTMDMGMSSFTDNAERQKQVDFVDYYNAGILWAAPAGKTVDPDDACGLKVAVQATTYEHTDELPAKSQACVDAGKPAIQITPFDTQDAAANAVVLGQADAMSADSPVTGYAIAQTDGKLEAAGDVFDAAPYGFPVEKGSELAAAVQAAMQSLVDDGTYGDILAEWGVESGAVDTIEINAGT
ncbi:polar amino acid transport system substrate-binding protein [Agromyces hippuratus]|uniref:Polar amino acid transport system substrate-binding protein n=1 Tax=Agromyces hippuratus TaxID=286438 RepID=A0A852WX14_9MICO|nr:ABC transporter substrate-binding protein [Agromyces hippuratus]NYG22656.1 polar amino acid transport system substrate-binding protein [Agromyces hippuratus]